jgi:hypothetical protein
LVPGCLADTPDYYAQVPHRKWHNIYIQPMHMLPYILSHSR